MPALPVPAAEAARRRAQRQRLRRRVMGAVFGVPLFFLACALYLLLGPKPPPPPIVVPVTPRQADQAEQHINAVRQALTQPQSLPRRRPLRPPPRRPASWTLPLPRTSRLPRRPPRPPHRRPCAMPPGRRGKTW